MLFFWTSFIAGMKSASPDTIIAMSYKFSYDPLIKSVARWISSPFIAKSIDPSSKDVLLRLQRTMLKFGICLILHRNVLWL